VKKNYNSIATQLRAFAVPGFLSLGEGVNRNSSAIIDTRVITQGATKTRLLSLTIAIPPVFAFLLSVCSAMEPIAVPGDANIFGAGHR
jgi:hypothetical protein